MKLTLREIKKHDLPNINKIRNYYILNTNNTLRIVPKNMDYEEKWYEDQVKSGFPTVVAIQDEIVVGYAYLSKFRDIEGYDKTLELSIFLHNEYSKNGIGTSLINAIEEKAKLINIHSIVSVITSLNQGSINFHLKNGFEISGVIKDAGFKNNEFLDVTFMNKIL